VKSDTFDAYRGQGKRAHYERRWSELKGERSSWDAHWQELSSYMQPRRTRFVSSGRNRGSKANQKIIDSTGRLAARTLQSGLHAGLTSPARPWFKLTTPDPSLAKQAAVREWLHEVTSLMQTIFSQTNLYNALPLVYGDIGVFGTGAMAILDDNEDVFRARAFPIGSYCLDTDNRDRVNTFMRVYEMTVGQIVAEFGGEEGRALEPGQDIHWDNISAEIKEQWDRGEYSTEYEILWAVGPNPDFKPDSLLAKDLPWASCYLERVSQASHRSDAVEHQKILRQGGFHEFPVMAPRWEVEGEDSYGTSSPGMDVLGDVKQLQSMHRKKAVAVEKLVDPPLVGPTALRNQKTSLLSGDITYVDTREGMQGLRAMHEININLQHLREDIAETQFRVRRAFYEDLFLMLAQGDPYRGAQPITAREVEERHEEKLLALGPVLERTNDELLDPLIDRVFGMMLRNQLVPEPPQEIRGVNLKVEYVSVMAQAQKLVGVVGQDRFLTTMVPLTQVFPELRHKVRIFHFADAYAEMLGVDPKGIVPDDEANEARDAEAQAAAAAQEAQVMQQTAQAMKDASQAPMSGDTALTRLAGAGAAPGGL
jgi:hypothetical protein